MPGKYMSDIECRAEFGCYNKHRNTGKCIGGPEHCPHGKSPEHIAEEEEMARQQFKMRGKQNDKRKRERDRQDVSERRQRRGKRVHSQGLHRALSEMEPCD